MSSISDKFLALTRQLFPTGRAFRVGYGSTKEKILIALSKSESRYHADALKILNSILPDNDGFTVDDATLWEHRLGMITNPLVSLTDRKTAILRKMQHPGNILARQSAGYLEDQLQLAGFNVFVHENIPAQSIENIIILPYDLGEMGELEMGELEMGSALSYFPDLFSVYEMGELEMGELEMGGVQYNNLIANSINQEVDSSFQIGSSFRCTFVIGGAVFGSFADVSIQRKDEFRQLILKCKPVQTIGYLLINYT